MKTQKSKALSLLRLRACTARELRALGVRNVTSLICKLRKAGHQIEYYPRGRFYLLVSEPGEIRIRFPVTVSIVLWFLVFFAIYKILLLIWS